MAALTDTCDIKGPYLPVGDVDWMCRTHDTTCVLRDPAKRGVNDLRRTDVRCPVGEPSETDAACPPECRCRQSPCLVCQHKSCGWCPECHPEVPDWSSS